MSEKPEEKKAEEIESGAPKEDDLEDARNMDENVYKESNQVEEDSAE